MKNIHLAFPLAFALILSIISSSCSSDTQSKNISDEDSTLAIPVEMAPTERGTISAYYSTTATLEAEQEATVVAKVNGIINEIVAEEGDIIQKGQLLARLEDQQFMLEADRNKATMDRLYNDFQRNNELFDRDLISANQFENAKFEYESQKATYDLARLNVGYTQIKAPITGIISDRMVKTGNMVNVDEQLFKITALDPLLAVLHVPEHEMVKLRVGQPAIIQADAVPNEQFDGKILRISPVVNPETGTFKVTIAVHNISPKLKPGMFGRIRIVYDVHQNALLIPKEAIMSEDGGSSVYVINDQLAYRRAVLTGFSNGSNIEILDGLLEGDRVVTIGQNSLQDSTLVQVVNY